MGGGKKSVQLKEIELRNSFRQVIREKYMTRKTSVSSLSEFDMSAQLRNKSDITDYLSLLLEERDTDQFIRSVGYFAKESGMTLIAHKTGLSLELLNESFSEDANPRFDIVLKALGALDIKLVAVTHK